jgi:hypothetical protein
VPPLRLMSRGVAETIVRREDREHQTAYLYLVSFPRANTPHRCRRGTAAVPQNLATDH